MIPENGHSQEQVPGMIPQNAATAITQHAGLTPEDAELLRPRLCRDPARAGQSSLAAAAS
jgi:hypothetical protein